MCFREKNNGGSNWAYKSEYVNTINVFIIETKPYTPQPTNPPRQGRNFTKVINVFCSEDLPLFVITCTHIIQKSTENRNSERRWKVRED